MELRNRFSEEAIAEAEDKVKREYAEVMGDSEKKDTVPDFDKPPHLV